MAEMLPFHQRDRRLEVAVSMIGNTRLSDTVAGARFEAPRA